MGFFFLNASGGFCLHGYVAALSCLLHHMVGRIGGDTTKSGVELVEGARGQRCFPWRMGPQLSWGHPYIFPIYSLYNPYITGSYLPFTNPQKKGRPWMEGVLTTPGLWGCTIDHHGY